jgi:hypothetical protein
MHVVASKPMAPARNPPRDSYAGLGGHTVLLEAPDKLPGSWDGPVYATLIGEPQHRVADHGPFFDDTDGRKRPAWQVTLTFLLPGQRLEDVEPALREHVDVPFWIPHWRLMQTSHNLAPEHLERPLLSVFRFLRFTEFFVATPRQDTKFTRHTSDVLLCGQVLDPGCSYICMVGIRGYHVERHQVVVIPLVDTRTHVISRDEFVLGDYHGLPATLQPPRFDTAWQSFCSSQLRQAFPAPGADLFDPIDMGSRAVSYVTPRGSKRAEIPVDYSWRVAHPPLATMNFEDADALPGETTLHQSTDAELPLLTRPEADLTPADLIAPALLAAHQLTPGVHLQDPSATARPPASGPGPAAQPSTPAPGLSWEALMQALLLKQRATNDALRRQLQVLSDSVVSIQHRLAVPTPRLAPGPSTSAHAALDSTPAFRHVRGEGERGLIRRDAGVHSRSPPPLRHGPGLTRRGAASPDRHFRSRSPVAPVRLCDIVPDLVRVGTTEVLGALIVVRLPQLVASQGLAPGVFLVVPPNPPGDSLSTPAAPGAPSDEQQPVSTVAI